MAVLESIFREYSRSDAEHSDRSAGDRARHRQKVRESIRENIADIIAEESIIGKDRDRVIKVPLRGIKEYRFIYGENAPGAGQGQGDTRPGQVVGKVGKDGKGEGQAGDRPGIDYYETDVTLDELIEIMFEDLELPNLERRALRQIPSDRSFKRKGYRHVGIRVRLDKRRTARQRVMRMLAARGRREAQQALQLAKAAELEADTDVDGEEAEEETPERRFPFHQDDLRYRHVETDTKEESNAVVMCIMDTSGSMDTMKKYLARSFFFMLYQFIATRYRNVEIVFIAHHTEAREVTEEEFFHKGEAGGTFISSGYLKALEIINERYHPSLWNIYAFHCSDGDNFDSDNPAALKSAKELSDLCNLFGYGEIKPLGSRYYESSMLNVFRRLEAPNFHSVLIERKEDIWPSFKAFLAKDRIKE
jgi:sporulation protein YhbH